MSLRDFAENELRLAGLFDPDSEYYGMLGPAVLRLVVVHEREGLSPMAADMAISLFEKVARLEPLTPLTGEDDEWNGPLFDEGYYQNKRCPHVFKKDGQAYDSEGRIFRRANGVCYTSKESRVPITFPYMPKREYVEVTNETSS